MNEKEIEGVRTPVASLVQKLSPFSTTSELFPNFASNFCLHFFSNVVIVSYKRSSSFVIYHMIKQKHKTSQTISKMIDIVSNRR